MSAYRLLAVLAALLSTSIRAEDRLPTISPSQYNPEQQQAAVEFESARKQAVFGPFEPMMHSPELMQRARAMGDYLRYRSALGNTLSELAILITARGWTQDYEWNVHLPIALKAGIKKEVVDAIEQGRHPTGLSEDEEVVYEYSAELLATKQVSDVTFARAKARFGPKGVVDLTGILGYYTLLAMQLNAARYPMPKEGKALPRLPP